MWFLSAVVLQYKQWLACLMGTNGLDWFLTRLLVRPAMNIHCRSPWEERKANINIIQCNQGCWHPTEQVDDFHPGQRYTEYDLRYGADESIFPAGLKMRNSRTNAKIEFNGMRWLDREGHVVKFSGHTEKSRR